MESEKDLLARYHVLVENMRKAEARLKRLKSPRSRSKQATWCGSIQFNLASIRLEMEKRGIKP